jgi:rubrerythrin
MRALLNDIRLLKLAELYERAYEEFVLEVAERIVDDEPTRAKLMHLVDPRDHHAERIAAHLARLNGAVSPDEHGDVLRAALMDVCDTERSARRFYLEHADKVHDPQVARLFRELAEEEGRHARLADEALSALERRLGTHASKARVEALRLGDELGESLPSWEGSADLGTTRLEPTRKR